MRLLIAVFVLCSIFSCYAYENVYFGLIHSHTEDYGDDGYKSYADAITETKNNGLDFFAISPHSHVTTQPNVDIAEEFRKLVADTETQNKKLIKDNFVLLVGQEWGVLKKGGHVGIYGFKDHVPIPDKDFDSFYKWAAKQPDMFLQFNHPRWEHFGEIHTPERDRCVTTIELFTGPGHSPSGPAKLRFDTFLEFLNRGWHVAPTSSQDNHKAAYSTANDARIGILADELSEASVMDAFLNSRLYATDDKNLKLKFYLKSGNKTIWMGSRIDYSEIVGNSEITLFAEVIDGNNENLLKFDIFYDEGKGGSWPFVLQTVKSNKIKFQIPPKLLIEGSLFFVRASQEDSDVAVSAPIWIGDNEHSSRNQLDDFFFRIPKLALRYTTDNNESVSSEELQATIDTMKRTLQRNIDRNNTTLLEGILNRLLEMSDKKAFSCIYPMLDEIIGNITVNSGDTKFKDKLELIKNN